MNFTRDLTVQETAETLGVHEETIRRWIKAGQLNAYRLNGRKLIRITRESIEQLKQPVQVEK